MTRRIFACLTMIGATACSELGPRESQSLTIRQCTAELTWFAYRNGDGPWTRAQPDTAGLITFDAEPVVSIAFVNGGATGSFVPYTVIINATADELAGSDLLHCVRPSAGLIIGGTVSIGSGSVARISGGGQSVTRFGPFANWSLAALRAEPIDLIAHRVNGGVPDRFIVRHSIIPATPPGQPLPVLDFASTEAVAPAVAMVTFTGAASQVDLVNFILSASGTTHEIHSARTTTSEQTYFSLPPSLRQPTDMHFLTATTSGPNGASSYQRAAFSYTTPSDRTVAFGPALAVPTSTALGSGAPMRLRVRLGSQAEYPDYSLFQFSQDAKVVEVITTAGYLGGTPATWEVTIPDLSSAQYQGAWGLTVGPYTYSAEAGKGDTRLALNHVGADGATLQSAVRLIGTTDPLARRAGGGLTPWR